MKDERPLLWGTPPLPVASAGGRAWTMSTSAPAVVVGVDGSTHSDTAVLWAASWACSTHRPLHLVHALGRLRSGDLLVGTAEVRELRRVQSHAVVSRARRLAQRVAPDLEVVTTSVDLDAREAMLAASEEAVMVVVGTRGHGRLAALTLGSVSVAVAGHAHGPVAVVRPQRTPGGDIVVGVAGDGSDEAAVLLAADLAVRRGVALDVVHAWTDHDTFVDTQSYGQRLDAVDERDRVVSEALAGLAEKFPDLEVRRSFPDRRPVSALVERSRSADCLVVGAHGRGGLGGLLGSVSRSVVELADCTTVVVRA